MNKTPNLTLGQDITLTMNTKAFGVTVVSGKVAGFNVYDDGTLSSVAVAGLGNLYLNNGWEIVKTDEEAESVE